VFASRTPNLAWTVPANRGETSTSGRWLSEITALISNVHARHNQNPPRLITRHHFPIWEAGSQVHVVAEASLVTLEVRRLFSILGLPGCVASACFDRASTHVLPLGINTARWTPPWSGWKTPLRLDNPLNSQLTVSRSRNLNPRRHKSMLRRKMAALTLETKIKLPSGYEIPQLGFGVRRTVSPRINVQVPRLTSPAP